MKSDIKAEQRETIEPILHHYFNGCFMQLSYNVPQVYRITGLMAAAVAVMIALIYGMIKKLK